MRRLAILASVAVIALGATAAGRAEVVQKGNLRVSFSGRLSPHALPRHGTAPISVTVGGLISTSDGTDPLPLERIEIAINRKGHLDPRAVPICGMAMIQPATTVGALNACRRSLVGDGSFSASVAIPGQAPFPSQGRVTVFNGRRHGRPAMLVHIYGVQPIPVSLTIPLSISKGGKEFGTILRGDLPAVKADIGFVRGLRIRLLGAAGSRDRRYLTAGCPAPAGFAEAIFPLVRAGFDFAGKKTLQSTLTRTCRATD